ncbi:DUF742 domain-containing protein [Micromonospora sp. WMMA1363]|uniref:DUF742 domain-containing protein n=1 Tax=Micromonospora sp. WMMA1363 TaxID=3053985 RepID=UPI00259D0FBC|nr:DUF742 domain-containing protein [Micromonospora sp. WMMA1363]MDM4719184.1 DUF742 domain-containing protein [Micromonospora sp. WMMA1363]
MTLPPDESAQELWVDDAAGPVVRPYALTHGRTRPIKGSLLDLISLVTTVRSPAAHDVGIGPEQLRVVSMCRRPLSVAEVAAHLNLPVGTVRVLLDDLLDRQLVQVREPRPTTDLPDDSIFEAVINGLRAL